MRDVSDKVNTLRTAVAGITLKAGEAGVRALRAGRVPKGDLFEQGRAAAQLAAKGTGRLIPDCHNIPLDYVGVEYRDIEGGVELSCTVKAVWKTGVEMEALTGAAAAALTLYDMLKPLEKELEITGLSLLSKRGGKSDYPERGDVTRAFVLVLSDSVSRGEREDGTGPAVKKALSEYGVDAELLVLPDDPAALIAEIRRLADEGCELLLTAGSTGPAPRDVAPAATLSLLDRRLEGIERALHTYGLERNRRAMLSGGVAGLVGKMVVVNLPGSPGAATEGVRALFPALLHAFPMLRGEGHD